MPDIFIPVDTTGRSSYFLAVRPHIYRFALKYTENNRENLSKFKNAAEMEEYLDKQDLLDQFIEFAATNKIKRDVEGLRISGQIINTQLKAYIARNILDNKGFYPIWKELDTTLKYAIDYLNN